MTCKWESFRPGMARRPARSMTCVVGPRSFNTSPSVPTERKPPAAHWRRHEPPVAFGFTVLILPL